MRGYAAGSLGIVRDNLQKGLDQASQWNRASLEKRRKDFEWLTKGGWVGGWLAGWLAGCGGLLGRPILRREGEQCPLGA